VVVSVATPAGSRRKSYEEIVVQDLVLNPSVTRYRRERWETPDGQTLIAARSGRRRRPRPAPASLCADAALSRTNDL
jgi:hypothetical protein